MGRRCQALTLVSGTVAVIVTLAGSGFVIVSLTRAETTSAVSSAFITALLPYSFSRASWNSLFFSSLATVSTLEVKSANAFVAVTIILSNNSGLLPHTLMELRIRSATNSFFICRISFYDTWLTKTRSTS